MPPASAPPPGGGSRLLALDVFRGATVAAMIFVNNPGDWKWVLPPFGHAEWHGWTPTDLVFPFFLFIAGVAGALSTAKRRARGDGTGLLVRHALVRGMTIVLVGWVLSAFPWTWERIAHLRIPGVLPRIGVVYALGTCLVLLAERTARPVRALVLLTGALLSIHTFLLLGTGFDLTRGHNVQRAVDLALLEGHLWKKDWDPEGIVSTLTAIGTFLTGSLAGRLLLSTRSVSEKARLLVASGLGVALLGQAGHLLLPVNKNLWTATYVLLTSGLGAAALGLSLFALDVWRAGEGRAARPIVSFCVTFGTNPLLAFVLSGGLARVLGLVKLSTAAGSVSWHAALFSGGFAWLPNPYLASHAWAAAVVTLWWGVLRVFEKRGIFWKV